MNEKGNPHRRIGGDAERRCLIILLAPIIPRNSGKVNVFELAHSINMDEVVTKYTGANLERHGNRYYIICPFHQEKTASCLIDEHRFKCFGCGESGDGITLVAKRFNLSPLDAAKLICRDFGLMPADSGYPRRSGSTKRLDPAAEQNRNLQVAFDIVVAKATIRLTLVRRCAEKTDLVDSDLWWRAAVEEIDDILDDISSRDHAIQVAAWRNARRWVG